MKTIEYTDAQSVMAQIAEALAKGETFTVEPKKPEKWKPKRANGGDSYYVNSVNGETIKCTEFGSIPDGNRAACGNYFLRQDHAEKARDPDRLRNIFRLFVLEHAPEFDVYGAGWLVFFGYDGTLSMFKEDYPAVGSIQAPQEVAQKFRDLYNAGLIDMGDA